MSSPANLAHQINRVPPRNFDNDTCCEAYCPCCPRCNCKCDCNCECNCTKKKMIIPTFILSAIAFVIAIVEMITKVTDTDRFIEFKKENDITLALRSDYNELKYKRDEILDIEDAENKFTLALFIISIFIFFVYLILLICFIYENVCFANYNPKCKRPYYMLMMILNFIACLANAMICFIFFSYRINSIDEYSDLEYFKGSDFKEKNDLNTGLNIVAAFCYLLCLIFHLIICYYLFREDGICAGCCSEFINCINCCGSCLKCCYICCCCCCNGCNCFDEKINQRRPSYLPPLGRRSVVPVYPQNFMPVIPYNPNQRNSVVVVQNQLVQESSQLRNGIGEDLKNKIERVCKNDVYGIKYNQFPICNICKKYFKENEEVTVLPCGHVFHKDCVYNWFISNKNCPEDGTVIIN